MFSGSPEQKQKPGLNGNLAVIDCIKAGSLTNQLAESFVSSCGTK